MQLKAFKAIDLKESLSEEEIKERQIRIEKLKEIGYDATKIGPEDCGIENPYLIEAMVYIIDGRDVPDSLKDRIKAFQHKKIVRRG